MKKKCYECSSRNRSKTLRNRKANAPFFLMQPPFPLSERIWKFFVEDSTPQGRLDAILFVMFKAPVSPLFCFYPGVSHRTFGNRTESNWIELNRTKSNDWVRFSLVIERNRTHKKIVNRTKLNIRLVRSSNSHKKNCESNKIESSISLVIELIDFVRFRSIWYAGFYSWIYGSLSTCSYFRHKKSTYT